MYAFRAEEPQLETIVEFNRHLYSGLCFLQTREHEGSIFIVYEQGASRVGRTGSLHWHTEARLLLMSSVEFSDAGLRVHCDGVSTEFDLESGAVLPAA